MTQRHLVRVARALIAAALLLTLVSSASAEIVRPSRGHVLGVTPHVGVAPSRVPGALAARSAASVSAEAGSTSAGDPGTVTYHSGSVMHSSAPYLLFWTPSGETIPASWQSLLKRYFADVAADSGQASNVYAVNRQYTDGSGFADARQSFAAAAQVVTDTNPYPARDASACPDVSPDLPTCLTDTQLETEIARELAAHPSLPTDGSTASAGLPAGAPIYFVVLPSDVNVCFATSGGTPCADNVFCAYHSSFTAAGANVIYATIPAVVLGGGHNPKLCQADSTGTVQEPNATAADVMLKYVAHEDNEAITDPLGSGWYDDVSGNETADNCNGYGPTADPAAGASPTAFLPTLGGTASSGTLYDQLINRNPYYLQSEWSNGDGGCEMQPTGASLAPSLATPGGPAGTPVSFTPSAGGDSVASATWDFGDGSATTFRAGAQAMSAVSHIYAAAGMYTVTLTLVDSRGDLVSATRRVAIGYPPTAAFSVTSATPASGQPTAFDASASTDSSAAITAYAWDFGDGQTTTGLTTTHVFAAPGTYTVTLTVQDSAGFSATVTHAVTVAGPQASLAAPAGGTVGQSLSFLATDATPGPGATLGYAWRFDDGATAGGPAVSHAFTTAGAHTVTLTVTNDLGQSDTITRTVGVGHAPPVAAPSLISGQAFEGSPVGVSAAGSGNPEPGLPLVAFLWSFGDGGTASGPTATHAYSAAGTYLITLTVTNAAGLSASATHAVTVLDEPISAAFAVAGARPASGYAVAFDGTSSADPDGTITAYAWSFGDGSSASGARPAHVFGTPGIYTVRLTVTGAAGERATTTRTVTVGLGGRIIAVRVRATATLPVLAVTVNEPGRLRFGRRAVAVRAAGTWKLQLRLSAKQRRVLRARGVVKVHGKLVFAPRTGAPSVQLLTIAVHAARAVRR